MRDRPQLTPAEQLNLLMKAIAFAFALLVVLIGFVLGSWTYAASGRPVSEASELAGGIVVLTVVLAGFIAALGGLMPWDIFLKILPRTGAAQVEGKP